MPRAFCESCNEHRDTRVKHILSEATLSPETEVICELCDYSVAVFDGHMMVTEPLKYPRRFTS
jgi:hypothetical protein